MKFLLSLLPFVAAVAALPVNNAPFEAVSDLTDPKTWDIYGDAVQRDAAASAAAAAHFREQHPNVHANLPVVQMHGMGDFATNGGMVSLKEMLGEALDTYVTNVQIGDSWLEDSMNSFFMNFDDQIEYFAKVVAEDPNLANGFNAIGYSQGVHVIRGYIERFNTPPVKNFISMHGPIAGVVGMPNCDPENEVCKQINSLLSLGAYNDFVQENLAQANYLKDPLNMDKYVTKGRYLSDVQNEKSNKNGEYAARFGSLQSMVAVRATEDTMVYPNLSEWFGYYQEGSNEIVVEFTETPYYQQDSFGLRTLNESGRLHFYTTIGQHLRFSDEFLLELVNKHFVSSA
eukprot:TRINITY_DN1812_c0_g1::TRINITY_DN1812_c0_g1_i1::g.14147::m.14147 TRINITY_DN1812_c0_g1::TRINITY_DN1812_c0_g1_i1::g.14147  ORF type:complete len:359 (+),score=127.62,sp/P50897/PPT1_HUMAN/37.73/5e-58,Palm_thioest/PF02089.10/1.7e-56 TRINITY_DN1812_c0_g1_i1:50-1078(+)